MQGLLAPVGEQETLLAGKAAKMYADAYLGSEGHAYMAIRGIPDWVADEGGVGFVDPPAPGQEAYAGMVSFAYSTVEGAVTGLRFRNLSGVGPKYTQPSGQRTNLYMVERVFDSEEAHITEGEIDCLSLTACGLNACGVPGANNWKDYYPRLLEGARRVFVWSDGDTAGDTMWKNIQESLPQAVRVPMPRGEDVNGLLAAGGVDAVLDVLKGVRL